MKLFQLINIVILSSSGIYAQSEFTNKTLTVPPPLFDNKVNTPPNSIPFSDQALPSVKTPSLFDMKTEKSAPFKIGKPENKINMESQNNFANPGDDYKRKMNAVPDRGDYKEFRKNQYLGDFKSKAKSIKVVYRDFGAVDGDMIRIYINGKIIRSEIYLISDFQGFDLDLKSGFNKIDFEALNQGSSGPNTAEFRVYDDRGILISGGQWNLATGFKATIIVVKEVE